MVQLRTEVESRSPSAEQTWQLAVLTEEVDGVAAAAPIYRRILQAKPTHAEANFASGRIMLEQGDERGLDLLDAAMSLDANSIVPACELAYQYLVGAGRRAEADP